MPTIVKVHDVNKAFKLPHERHNSLKSLFVNLFRKKRGYEVQEVLRNISFDIEQGDFFGIVGRNGSGKSTLLKLMAGIYAPDKGTIDLAGKLTPFIELGVGFNPELSGRDNVFMNGALLGFNRKEVEAMYDEIVAFAELERFMDQRLKNYSSGMQVRLAFSIAIKAKSDILLLDEVLAVGDAAFQQKCFDYFNQLKQDKKTVIFVSHDMSAVTRFCNKAIYLKDGDLIKQGTPTEIADIYKLENIEGQNKASGKDSKSSSDYGIKPKIETQTDNEVKFSFSYKSPGKDNMYIAFSLLKDGISIAEMTSSIKTPLRGDGTAHYTLDTSILNPGLYQFTAVLCELEGRRLLSVGDKTLNFKVKGQEDVTRAAAIKLANTWE